MDWRFLYSNGVVSHSPDVPHVSNLLESHPGAYTTTRTHNNATCLLFWSRHLRRLANSALILVASSPQLFFGSDHNPSLPPSWHSLIGPRVNEAVSAILPIALTKRNDAEELAVTALVSGNNDAGEKSGFDVYVHVAGCVPPVFGGVGASVAVVGPGRDVAGAKYSDWVRSVEIVFDFVIARIIFESELVEFVSRLRKQLEKLRPGSVTELLLSNDGDHVLEGCVTNFYVVSRKENNDLGDTCPFEVQTAPVTDGVLPGIIRQVVIDVCISKGVPIREVAPSWSKRELWEEAFITNSLRIMEHVKKVQFPNSWESLQLKTLEEISWEEKQFGDIPGMITATIQKEVMEKAIIEGHAF